MIIRRICILGGSGFVGASLANRLTQEGYRIRVLTRDREMRRGRLILLPTLDLVEANVHDAEVLKKQTAGCDAVINLVGILNERGRDGSGFRRVHVDLARNVLDACRANGIRRLLHMSALNADAATGPSHYLRTKGEAEQLVHAAHDLHVTSFRPSVIFGPRDSFYNRFATLLRITPLVFPLACPNARFAPVYVEDVAEAFARALKRSDTYGRQLALCGPHVYTLEQIVRYTMECLGIHRFIMPLPDLLSRIQAAVFDFVPGKPFSTDNYLSTRVDSVCDRNDLQELGITPTAVEAIVPTYLSRNFTRARYQIYRSRSGRNAGP